MLKTKTVNKYENDFLITQITKNNFLKKINYTNKVENVFFLKFLNLKNCKSNFLKKKFFFLKKLDKKINYTNKVINLLLKHGLKLKYSKFLFQAFNNFYRLIIFQKHEFFIKYIKSSDFFFFILIIRFLIQKFF